MANYETSAEYNSEKPQKEQKENLRPSIEAQPIYPENRAPHGLNNNEWKLYDGIIGKREILKEKQGQSEKSMKHLERLSEWTKSSDVQRTLEGAKSNHKRISEELDSLDLQYELHKTELDDIESKVNSDKRRKNITKIELDIKGSEGILSIRQKFDDSGKFELELTEKRKNLEQLKLEEDEYQTGLKTKNQEAPKVGDFAETGSAESIQASSNTSSSSSIERGSGRDEISEHAREVDALMEKVKKAQNQK